MIARREGKKAKGSLEQSCWRRGLASFMPAQYLEGVKVRTITANIFGAVADQTLAAQHDEAGQAEYAVRGKARKRARDRIGARLRGAALRGGLYRCFRDVILRQPGFRRRTHLPRLVETTAQTAS